MKKEKRKKKFVDRSFCVSVWEMVAVCQQWQNKIVNFAWKCDDK